MALLVEYSLPTTQEHLLVANVHGINFVTNGTFYDHITQIIATLKGHRGPLIFAGDFNTWNSARLEFLQEQSRQLGLEQVQFRTDPRRLPLDHIFYRGLKADQADILSNINSSDHLPLQIEFNSESVPKQGS
jgi:endonuclease/exonuclease/phosphatase (EEP) superfamily protein YafD